VAFIFELSFQSRKFIGRLTVDRYRTRSPACIQLLAIPSVTLVVLAKIDNLMGARHRARSRLADDNAFAHHRMVNPAERARFLPGVDHIMASHWD
jgi:hypothetical protein